MHHILGSDVLLRVCERVATYGQASRAWRNGNTPRGDRPNLLNSSTAKLHLVPESIARQIKLGHGQADQLSPTHTSVWLVQQTIKRMVAINLPAVLGASLNNPRYACHSIDATLHGCVHPGACLVSFLDCLLAIPLAPLGRFRAKRQNAQHCILCGLDGVWGTGEKSLQ